MKAWENVCVWHIGQFSKCHIQTPISPVFLHFLHHFFHNFMCHTKWLLSTIAKTVNKEKLAEIQVQSMKLCEVILNFSE